MKTRIAVAGAGLLLTIGSAVAGSLIYGQSYGPGRSGSVPYESAVVVAPAEQEVTAERIALWKMTAASSDYTAPRVPI